MDVHFHRLHIGYPDEQQAPTDDPDAWRVFLVCASARTNSCLIYGDVSQMSDQDQGRAHSTFETLFHRANTGEPLTSLYDEKQLHEAFTFSYECQNKNRDVKVLRIRGAGATRVYFIYPSEPRKSIVILKVAVKRSDKLAGGEKADLEALATAVLHQLENNRLEDRVI